MARRKRGIVGSEIGSGSTSGSAVLEMDGTPGMCGGSDEKKARFKAGLGYTESLAESAIVQRGVDEALHVNRGQLAWRIACVLTAQCIHGLTDVRDFERFAEMVQARLEKIMDALRRLSGLIAERRECILHIQVVSIEVRRLQDNGDVVGGGLQADENPYIEEIIRDPDRMPEGLQERGDGSCSDSELLLNSTETDDQCCEWRIRGGKRRR